MPLFKLSSDWSSIICLPLVSPVWQTNFLNIYYVLYIWFVLFHLVSFFLCVLKIIFILFDLNGFKFLAYWSQGQARLVDFKSSMM